MVGHFLKLFQKYRADQFFSASLLVSLGILLTTTGGGWDITNHLINKPETFFSLPHSVLYAGALTSLLGSLIMYRERDHQGSGQRSVAARIAIVGSITLIGAGPADFAWHYFFGLDGLLSPTHLVLVLGMIASSMGGLYGIRLSVAKRETLKTRLVTVLAILPTWLAAAGMIDMLSLPFSNTVHFRFNPDPSLAAVLATIAFPFLSSVVLISGSLLSSRKFGYVTLLGTSFVTVVLLTSIMPDEKIRISIPFYMVNMIPIFASDVIMAVIKRKVAIYISGALLGISFFTLYFPLITNIYNELLTSAPVWPSATIETYFTDLSKFIPVVAVPSLLSGVIGSIVGIRLNNRLKTRSIQEVLPMPKD